MPVPDAKGHACANLRLQAVHFGITICVAERNHTDTLTVVTTGYFRAYMIAIELKAVESGSTAPSSRFPVSEGLDVSTVPATTDSFSQRTRFICAHCQIRAMITATAKQVKPLITDALLDDLRPLWATTASVAAAAR